MKWMKLVLPIALLGVGIGGMKAIEAAGQDETEKAPIDVRPTVRVEQLEPTSIPITITSYGEVTPVEQTNLAAQVSGEVETWHPNFIAGGIVKRGDVLFTIEKDTYEAALLLAESSLSSAQAALIEEKARAEVARIEAKGLPQERVTDLYLRKPQLLSAQAAVKSAEAQLRIAKRDLDNCVVRAPYDALIVSRAIGVGDYVTTGKIAAVINNIESAEITFPVAGFDQAFLPDELAGRAANVKLNSDRLNHITRKAVIHRDLGIVDEATRMTHLVARIEDPYALHSDEKVVKFGSYVVIDFVGRTVNNVYKIQQDLITRNRLWVIDDNNKMQAKPVTIIREEEQFLLVEANLDRREKVIMTLPEYPQNGLEVKLAKASSAANAEGNQQATSAGNQ